MINRVENVPLAGFCEVNGTRINSAAFPRGVNVVLRNLSRLLEICFDNHRRGINFGKINIVVRSVKNARELIRARRNSERLYERKAVSAAVIYVIPVSQLLSRNNGNREECGIYRV